MHAHHNGAQPVVHLPGGEPLLIAVRRLLHDRGDGAAEHEEVDASGPAGSPGQRRPRCGGLGPLPRGLVEAGAELRGPDRQDASQGGGGRCTGDALALALPPRHPAPAGQRHQPGRGSLPQHGQGDRSEDGERPDEDPAPELGPRGRQRQRQRTTGHCKPGLGGSNKGHARGQPPQQQPGPRWQPRQHGRQPNPGIVPQLDAGLREGPRPLPERARPGQHDRQEARHPGAEEAARRPLR
mmetsp:Transcript_7145/g.21809  ORF Transcript_7145/g.21809 Transcript_7145/m.21809 type:complete len:239 (+) Transcript_7145:685-1401(+)